MKKALTLLLISFNFLFAQEFTRKDTLIYQLEKTPIDTNRVNILDELINETYLNNPKEALKYSIEITELSDQLDFKIGMAQGYGWQGYFYEILGDIDQSLEMYFRTVTIYKEIHSFKQLSTMYNNIAFCYMKTGKAELALEYNLKSLHLNVQLNDTSSIVASLINTAGVYYRQDKFKLALESCRTALILSMKKHDEILIASSLRNLARIFKGQNDYEEAFYCYSMAYKLSSRLDDKEKMGKELNGMGNVLEAQGNNMLAFEFYKKAMNVLGEFGYKREMGNTFNNVGHYYYLQNQLDSALIYYENALVNYREILDNEGISQATYHLGEFYHQQKNNQLAEKFAQESYQLSEQMGYPTPIMNSSFLLYQCYEANGKFKECVDINNRYLQIKDTVDSNEDRKLIEKQKEQFDESIEAHKWELEEIERNKKLESKIIRRNLLEEIYCNIALWHLHSY